MTSIKGKLLVAAPTLDDGTFSRAVVLVAEHSDRGAMGLVLNRPSHTLVAESVDELGVLLEDADATVYVGGPVQEQAVMVLAEFDDPHESAALVVGDVGFLPAGADMDQLAASTRRARVFAGHAGWGPGQLDDELAEGSWIVVDAEPGDPFVDPEALWAAVLARRGGPYAVLAHPPADPSVN